MEKWHRTPGGTKYWWVSYPYEENGEPCWSTMNQLTTSEGGSSTLGLGKDRNGCAYNAISGTIETTDKHSGQYAEVIRTVGWGAGNTAAVFSGMGTCNNATAGELYLGSYADGANYGIDFVSRPKSITFWYKYVPKNNSDQASAQISVYDASNNVIASKEVRIDATGQYTRMTMVLDYPADCAKAASLDVRFKSSVNDVNNR